MSPFGHRARQIGTRQPALLELDPEQPGWQHQRAVLVGGHRIEADRRAKTEVTMRPGWCPWRG